MSELGKKLIGIVQAKAAEYPDYVYTPPEGGEQCFYVHRGEPSCLIGQALWATGLIDGHLESAPPGPDGVAINEESFRNVVESRRFPGLGTLDWPEVCWLSRVQFWQDHREPWARAVKFANDEFGVAND